MVEGLLDALDELGQKSIIELGPSDQEGHHGRDWTRSPCQSSLQLP
jgi:hypothetical protein